MVADCHSRLVEGCHLLGDFQDTVIGCDRLVAFTLTLPLVLSLLLFKSLNFLCFVRVWWNRCHCPVDYGYRSQKSLFIICRHVSSHASKGWSIVAGKRGGFSDVTVSGLTDGHCETPIGRRRWCRISKVGDRRLLVTVVRTLSHEVRLAEAEMKDFGEPGR